MAAQAYWDKIYSESVFKSGKSPLPFLVDMFPRLQKGKLLDIAMGEGANAVFLAQKGMSVKGFDISPVAIERANQLAKETGVSSDFKTADLDLFLLGLMEYDSIIMTNFKPLATRYYSELIRALKQGGTLLVQSYMINEMKEAYSQDEGYKNYFYSPNELLQNLKGLRILFYHEGDVNGKTVVQCLAQKPLDKDAAKYNLFSMSTTPEKPKSPHLDLAESIFKKK